MSWPSTPRVCPIRWIWCNLPSYRQSPSPHYELEYQDSDEDYNQPADPTPVDDSEPPATESGKSKLAEPEYLNIDDNNLDLHNGDYNPDSDTGPNEEPQEEFDVEMLEHTPVGQWVTKKVSYESMLRSRSLTTNYQPAQPAKGLLCVAINQKRVAPIDTMPVHGGKRSAHLIPSGPE